LKKRNEWAILRVVIATGISSVVTQLLLIREFLAQFEGNEFVIALIIFNWLVLGGIGTLLARISLSGATRPTSQMLGWLTFCLAALPSMQILAVRWLRDVFFVHGSSVGFYPTLLFIAGTMAPYALLIGFVLPLSLFVLRRDVELYPGVRIYIIDNIGDVAGGVLFSFLLVYLLTPLEALFAVNCILLVAAMGLFTVKGGMRLSVYCVAAIVLALLLAGILLERPSLATVEGELVYYHESPYGRILVQKQSELYTLFADGVPRLSSQNRILAEEVVHYPLSQLAGIQDVLLISAEGGIMHELRKYSPENIDYVELDPELTAVEFRYGLINTIPGLQIIHNDGRAFLRATKKTYDAIVMNLPEPETFQINRFYTLEFLALAKRHLGLNGVLSFAVKGFENYLAEPQIRKISALYNTASKHFKHVVLLPGSKTFFVCSDAPLVTDIPARLTALGIATDYIGSYYYGNVSEERISYLRQALDPSAPLNQDISPSMMRFMFSGWFAKYATSPLGFMIFTGIFCAVYFFWIRTEEFVLFSTGCMTMGSEILVIFAFQIFFGYIYLMIGLIVTVFLAGLLPGAFYGGRLKNKSRKVLVLTDGMLIALMALMIAGLGMGGQKLPQGFYYAFAFTISVLCGFQFPVALHLRGGDNPAVTRAFSADLIGAACGTLVTSVVLIPYLGIIWAAAGLIVLKSISIMIAGTSHETHKQKTVFTY